MSVAQSHEELEGTLSEHRTQLQQVEELLLLDPHNEELADMYNSLSEVIQMTEEVLQESRAQQQQQQQQQPTTAGAASAPTGHAGAPSSFAPQYPTHAGPSSSSAAPAPSSAPIAQVVAPPMISLPSILPASVADQIRRAQIKAALSGQAPPSWAIGAKVEALYAADGQYYNAKIDAVSVNGQFIVAFDGYPDKEEVAISNVRPPSETNEVYKGVSAPKRKRVEEAETVTEIPKWLEIKDTDDEKTRLKKKKLLKSYKSKIRFQTMDVKSKEKQANWQDFIKGKGKKKAQPTGLKKESIFKSPETLEGKVGVVGSGKGMTNYVKPARHEHDVDD